MYQKPFNIRYVNGLFQSLKPQNPIHHSSNNHQPICAKL